jgi:hypothetical protein
VKEKDFEICAVNTQVSAVNLLVLCIYRSPSGDFAYFMDQLELVLCRLYKLSTNIVTCGDFNVNFLESTPRVDTLSSLMASFGLCSVITFPTRNSGFSHTIIDNFFIDANRFKLTAQPLINGLSDHDAQIVMLHDIISTNTSQIPLYTRIIDSISTVRFIEMLSNENWEDVFHDSEVNFIFNTFHNIYLRLFYCCFLLKKKPNLSASKPWITNGIKISCAKKSELFRTYRCTKDPRFKVYYKTYCKILAATIVAAKNKYYDEQILKSQNKIKATWNIIKTATNNRKKSTNLNFLNIKNCLTSDPVLIAEAFNAYFSSIAGQIIMEATSQNKFMNDNPLSFLHDKFKQLNSRLKFKFTTTHEINTFRPHGVYILRGLSSHQSGAL